MKMKKMITVISAFFLSMVLFAGIASAHVTIFPKETTQGTYEKFTVRVPTEKEIPTVKVEVKIPEEVNITRFEPKPGWNYELTKDASGKITGVTWTSTGEGLSATEFGEFNMQGKVGDKATSLVWKAYQTYNDGSVVEWVGAENSDKPASVTKVNAKTADTGVANHTQQQTGAPSALPLWLSVAALVIALLSLLVSFTKKRA